MSFINKVKETFGWTDMSASSKFKAFLTDNKDLQNLMNIYERPRNPHYEMKEAMYIFMTNPEISTATDLFSNSIIGNNLEIVTDNPEMKRYMELNVIPKLKPALREAIESMVITGNGYIEILRGINSDKPLKFKHIPHPQNMYIDFDKEFNPTKYVLGIQGFQGESHSVRYVSAGRISVQGVAFETKDIIHLKKGQSFLPVYGRSNLCSCIAEAKVLREIMNNEAIIARYKSINRKIVRFLDEKTGISNEELQRLGEEMRNLPLSANFLTNKDVDVKDMSYAGQHVDYQPTMRWFSRRMSSTLAPAFYTHGEVTNYAVAKEQKNAYYLQIGAIRDYLKEPINKILREIGKIEYNDEDVEIEFGDFDFPTREDEFKEIIEKWKAGLMKLKHVQEKLGLEVDEEIGDAYFYELTSEQQQATNNLLKKLGD